MEGPVRKRLNLRALLSSVLHGREYGIIQLSLTLAETREWRLGTRRKHVVAVIVLWLGCDDSESGLRQRNEIRALRFVALSRDGPYPIQADFSAAHMSNFIASLCRE